MRVAFRACVALVAFASSSTTFATTAEAMQTSSVVAPGTASPATRTSRGEDHATTRVHLGIVSCDGAPFYSWPDRSSIPSGTAYPPARMGDAIHVIGDGTLAPGGTTLYETTIDVFLPFGVGKHFYISARCINAG